MPITKRRLGLVLLLGFLLGSVTATYLSVMHIGLTDWGSNRPGQPYTYYPTAAELAAYLYALAAEYPDSLQVASIGSSHHGRPILAAVIASPSVVPATERPGLLIVAQQHGREPISSQAALFAVETLLREQHSNPAYAHLLASRTIYFVPQANPDGNDIFLFDNFAHRGNARPADLDGDGLESEDGREGVGVGALIRQIVRFTPAWIRDTGGNVFSSGWAARDNDGRYINVRGLWNVGYTDFRGLPVPQRDNDSDGRVNEDGIMGVDLNRNWDAEWESGVDNPASFTYRGPTVWSEPEVIAVRDFILANPNIVAALDVHSGVDLILLPYSRTKEEVPPDLEVMEEVAAELTRLTKSTATQASIGLYVAYGTIKDWVYEQGILMFVPEIYQGNNYTKARRLWPTNYYVAYSSTAQAFNPPPRHIGDHALRWQPLFHYMLAALPEPYIAALELVDGQLFWQVGNAGQIGSDISVALYYGGQRLLSQDLGELRDESRLLNLAQARDGDYRLVVRGTPSIQIREHPLVQELELEFSIADGVLYSEEPASPPDYYQLFRQDF